MESSKFAKLFGKNPLTRRTIFHEIAESGMVDLLYRIRDNVQESVARILQEKDETGNLSTHVAVTTHRGPKVIQLVKALLELGADINAMHDVTRSTILHLAVMRGDYELVEWLAQQPRIDLDVRGWDEMTAHDIAFIENDQRMLDILEAHGARGPQSMVLYDWSAFIDRDE